jgi:sRNA-binding protein
MKKNKLDFLLDVTDNMRADVNQSNKKSSAQVQEQNSAAVNPTTTTTTTTPSTPLPTPQKQKREEKKITTNSIDGFFDKKIEAAGITITKEMLDSIEQAVVEINSGLCHVRIHPEHDIQLSIMAKKLRYEHRLRGRGGISKMALIYLILDNALKGVQ